ncbi:MAG: CotH kinase family protein [Gemmataceae bacterium]
MTRLLPGNGLLLACLFATLPPTNAEPPTKESDAFFKEGKVLQLSISLEKADLDSLRREPRKYARATLQEGDKVFRDVGIHVKGAAGSFRGIDDKPGLTLNMNKFGAAQTFHGMDKWHLANSVQDATYVQELICGELMRAAGIPASRVGHAVVTINGRKRGLYYLKEGYDKFFRKRWFENLNGNFYDGGFLRDLDQPLHLLSGGDDVKNHADLKALLAAATERDHAVRLKKLDKLLELDKFLSYVALEVICWDWDGYPINRNNYRVYHDPKRDKITFLPSGMDQMFGDPNGTILPHFQGVVARSIVETKEGRKRYLDRMEEMLKKVVKADDLVKRLDELEKRVQPALAAVDAGAGQGYRHHVGWLRNNIKARLKSVEDQLKRAKK